MVKILHSKKIVLSFSLTILFTLVNLISYTYTNNPPLSYTNAPSESNCTSCHSGGGGLITSGNNWSSITLTANGGALEYYPDSNFNMELIADISNVTKYGFEIVALDSTNNRTIGAFTITNSTRTGKNTNNVGGNSREYVFTKSGGTAAQSGNQIKWNFDWKAPSANNKVIKFYVIVNATNNNNGSGGDAIYAKVFTMRISSNMPSVVATVNTNTLCKDDTLFCQGSGINATTYNWNIYNSSNASIASDTGSQPYFLIKNPGTYKVKVKASNNKGAAYDSQIVVMNNKPTASIAANGNLSFCNGDSVELVATVTSGASILWNNNDTNASIYVKTSGTYQVTANVGGCSDTSNSITVTVNASPTVSINATGNTSICGNDSVELVATASSGASLTWNTNDTTSIIYVKNAGTYRVNASLNGCSDSSNAITVNVSTNPTVSISASGSTTFCSNDSVLLTANATAGSTFLWNNNDTNSSIYAKTSGSYKVKAILNGCSDTSNVIQVVVNALPTISISNNGNTNICDKDSVQLTASASAGSSILWNNNSTSTTIYAKTSGDYKAKATLNGCLDSSNTISITVHQQLAAPTINCGNTTLNSVTYTWQSLSGATGYEVSENHGSTWIQPSSGSNGTTHTRTGLNANNNYTLWIRALDNSPCQKSEIDSVTCNTSNCNATTYTVDFDSSVCSGLNDTINFNITSTSNFAILYNGQYSKNTQYIVNIQKDSTFKFEIIDSLQIACPSQKVSIPIKLASLGGLSAAILGNGACEGISQTFEASAGYSNYIFKDKQGNVLQNSSSNTYTTNDKNIILAGLDVTIANATGCSYDIQALPGKIFNTYQASFTSSQLSKVAYNFKTTSPIGIKSTWDFGDGSIDSSNKKSINHLYSIAGTYTIKLTESNQGCSDDTSMQLKVGNLGIFDPSDYKQIAIYPNPISDQLVIDYSLLKTKPMSVEILDVNGKSIFYISENQINKNSLLNIATESLSPGVYIIKISTLNDGMYYQKVLKN